MPTFVSLLLRLRFRSTIHDHSIHCNCSDPRMSQIVVHGGIVYLSGQVDQEATDAEGQTKGEGRCNGNRTLSPGCQDSTKIGTHAQTDDFLLSALCPRTIYT